MGKLLSLAANQKFQQRRNSRAYSFYEQASKLDENKDSASLAEALALYEKAIELDPTLALAYTNAGNIHYRRGDCRKAREFYTRALSVDTAQPEARYNLGYLCINDGDAGGGIFWLLSALQLDPKFALAHYQAALAYVTLCDAKSVFHFNEYLRLEPNGKYVEDAKISLKRI